MRKFVLTLILAAACTGAVAAPERTPFDAQAVISQQQQIRADIEAKRGVYGKLDIATRQEVRERQDQLLKLLDGRSYEQLSAEEQDQARLNMAWIEYAGKQDDDRLVCERIRTTGSNRVERVCKTVAQRRAEKEASKNNADQMLQSRAASPCGPEGCQ